MSETQREAGSPIPKEELIARFWRERAAILGHIWNLVHRWEASEDIFQQACLKFLASPATFTCFLTAAKYFHKTILSLVIDKQQRDSRFVDSDQLPELVCEPEPEWQRQLTAQKVQEAMGLLSSRDQQLLTVYLLPGFDMKEASSLLDMPARTYRYQLRKAFSRLRKSLVINARQRRTAHASQIGGN